MDKLTSRPHLTPLLVAVIGLTQAFPTQAENYQRGQQLYDHHCQFCHEDLMHQKSRKLESLSELRQRIENWSSHTGNSWSREEVDDVLYYLNKRFYRFDYQAL